MKNKLTDLKLISSALPDSNEFLLMGTRLDDSARDIELFGQALVTVRRRDHPSHGGGVLIAVPSGLLAVRRDDIEQPELETIFLQLYHPKGRSLLVCAYCPPSTRATAYKLLDTSITKALTKYYWVVFLFGAFNSHIDWWSSDAPLPSNATDGTLLSLESTSRISQICHFPTYIPNSSFLDLVFVSLPSQSHSCDVYSGLSGSDRLAIDFTSALVLPCRGHFARVIWKFHQTGEDYIAKLAHLAPWCMTTMGEDCLANMDLWCNLAHAIQLECMPCVSTRRGRARAP